jgi:hypothetical protein
MIPVPAVGASAVLAASGDGQPPPRGTGRLPVDDGRLPPPVRPSSANSSLGAAYIMIASVLIGLGLGYLIDQHYGTLPWWTLGMTFLWLAVGFYHLLKEGNRR